MYILGINSAYHESSACLLEDGKIVAAVEEERFTRQKHAKPARVDNPDDLPVHAINYCLRQAGITIADVDHIGFSLSPQLRLKNTEFGDAVEQNSWGSKAGETVFFRKLLLVPEKLRALGFKGKFSWIEHHVCHAASAFYPSPFEEAAVLTVDGIGEISSTAFAYGNGRKLKTLEEILYPHSLGFLWEKICKFMGYTDYDACKVMSLASFATPERFRYAFERLVQPAPEGRFTVANDLLNFRVEEYAALEELFRVKRREKGEPLEPVHYEIAASLQEVTNELVLHLVNYIHEKTGSENLCMAGGVVLNCVTNTIIYERGPFRNLYIQPAANDAGTAVGAASFIWNAVLGNEERAVVEHPYLGTSFSDEEIEQALRQGGLVYERVENIEAVVAELLSRKKIVGWFQGAMEFGPRALGNRSLLADPRDAEMQGILNTRIKHRETYRPFAPSILAEEADKWFEIRKPTPASDFMLMAYPVRPEQQDAIPAVIHVDNTSRIQTVRKENNARYYKLISEFFKLTGVPIVLNTSFNDNEPIVSTPQHAVETFKHTEIDYLAIGDFLIDRMKQSSAALKAA